MPKRAFVNYLLIFPVLLGFIPLFALVGCQKKTEIFSDENVIAQFSNGIITTDQVTAYISRITPKCHAPAMECHANSVSSGCESDESCEVHDMEMGEGQMSSTEHTGSSCCGGQHEGEHAGCCGGTDETLKTQKCSEHLNCCIQHLDLKVEDYREFVRSMVFEQVLQEYIRENNIGHEEDTQALIQYLTRNIYVQDAHLDMEEAMKPAELEIRDFYERNKEDFGLKTLNEVRSDIEKILKNKMHRDYMPRYLDELKRSAFIKKNMEMLKPREPYDYELERYYSENNDRFVQLEMVRIRQILTHSRHRAEQAQSQLRTGASFSTVAKMYSEGHFANTGGELPNPIRRGERSATFEDIVFRLPEGDTSMLFEDNGDFYIVQVIEKYERRIKSLMEVSHEVRELLLKEAREKLFEENGKRTLFTVNNRSYSLDEFKQRLDNLPGASWKQFNSYTGMETLVDRIIEYELLADDARHKMFDPANKETVQSITNAILENTLFEQEVVGKIGIEDIPDDEAMKYYRDNEKEFLRPPKATISYIRVPISKTGGSVEESTEKDREAAMKLAEEAYQMIENGSDFEVVARRYSADDWSTEKLDMFEEKNQPVISQTELKMHPIHEVVFSLRDGEVSKPFQFANNYFVFKLWEKVENEPFNFEEVQMVIKQMLVVQKRKEIAEELKNELMEKSQLVINDRAIKTMVKRG
jgi:parvulin-like peptidyl-prolyl isomerase